MKNRFGIFFGLLLLLSFINFVSADIGPKPSADIHMTFGGIEISEAFNAKMLTCQKQDEFVNFENDLISQLNISQYDSVGDCYWRPAAFAWGGDCKNSYCSFDYFLPDEFKLAVYLPSQDKVYLSSEVLRKNFRSTFEADLSSTGNIEIYETTSFVNSDSFKQIKLFFFALILTIALELIVALIYTSIKKIRKKILITILIANIISLPLLWFVFSLFSETGIILGEIFAFVFEAYFIYYLNKKIISLNNSFILSLLMNLASLIIGGVIFISFTLFF